MRLRRCVQCGSEDLRIRNVEDKIELEVARKQTAVFVRQDMPAVVCETCGEAYFGSADVGDFELQVAMEAGARGFIHGPVLRFMRTAISFSAKDLANLLDVTAETVSRWENGHTAIPRTVFIVVTALVEDHAAKRTVTRERLEAARRDQDVPTQINIRAA